MGPNQMGPNQMGPNQMGPSQMGPNQMGPNQMGPNQMGPSQMGPNQMGPNQMGPNQMGPNQIGPNQMGPNQMSQNQFFYNPHCVGYTYVVMPPDASQWRGGPMPMPPSQMEFGPGPPAANCVQPALAVASESAHSVPFTQPSSARSGQDAVTTPTFRGMQPHQRGQNGRSDPGTQRGKDYSFTKRGERGGEQGSGRTRRPAVLPAESCAAPGWPNYEDASHGRRGQDGDTGHQPRAAAQHSSRTRAPEPVGTGRWQTRDPPPGRPTAPGGRAPGRRQQVTLLRRDEGRGGHGGKDASARDSQATTALEPESDISWTSPPFRRPRVARTSGAWSGPFGNELAPTDATAASTDDAQWHEEVAGDMDARVALLTGAGDHEAPLPRLLEDHRQGADDGNSESTVATATESDGAQAAQSAAEARPDVGPKEGQSEDQEESKAKRMSDFDLSVLAANSAALRAHTAKVEWSPPPPPARVVSVPAGTAPAKPAKKAPKKKAAPKAVNKDLKVSEKIAPKPTPDEKEPASEATEVVVPPVSVAPELLTVGAALLSGCPHRMHFLLARLQTTTRADQ
mmetsp:Transcript_110970/g.254357  ORF Transcript_110970/g.254357 Transcript_110970/m.254357 type:complete len:568 (-) Transcript_110970:386-2089(-)